MNKNAWRPHLVRSSAPSEDIRALTRASSSRVVLVGSIIRIFLYQNIDYNMCQVAQIRERYTVDVVRGMLIRSRFWPRSFAVPLDETIHRIGVFEGPVGKKGGLNSWQIVFLWHVVSNVLDDRNAVSPVVAKEGMKLWRVLKVLVQVQNYGQLFVVLSLVDVVGGRITAEVNVLEQLNVIKLQYRQHDLRPGFTEMFVVGAAQNGLQDVDSGLDTVQFGSAVKLTNAYLTVFTVVSPAASILYRD
ncbi:hypothetical protein KCV07_g102, partial [Aureobasidium melanogenum]